MTKNNLNPHDRFFRKMLADKNVVQEFFTFHLPDKIKKNIDFSSIKLKKDSYISDNLREKIVDLLFQANFNNVIGYIYLLIEHQSQPEKFMPFRILKYMMAIMEDHLHSTKDSTLPIIYPMIFYSGDRSYNYSTDLFDLFSDRNLAREILYQPYQLINIHQIPHKQLERFLYYGTLTQIMRDIHKYRKNVIPLLRKIMDKLQQIENLGEISYIITAVSYFLEAGEADIKEFTDVIHDLKNKGEPMSLANKLRDEGYRRGVEETKILAEQLRAEGYQRGIEGKKLGEITIINKIAINLLRQNLDIKSIAASTELPVAKILELKKSIQNQ